MHIISPTEVPQHITVLLVNVRMPPYTDTHTDFTEKKKVEHTIIDQKALVEEKLSAYSVNTSVSQLQQQPELTAVTPMFTHADTGPDNLCYHHQLPLTAISQ